MPAHNALDLTGQRFGHLTVVAKVEAVLSANGGVMWDVVCDCGKRIQFSTNQRKDRRYCDNQRCSLVATHAAEAQAQAEQRPCVDCGSTPTMSNLLCAPCALAHAQAAERARSARSTARTQAAERARLIRIRESLRRTR